MRTFYDPIEPYDVGRLPVSPLHTLYYEQSRQPRGAARRLPARRTGRRHDAGATGASSTPAAYRIVLFDQRGCGKSTPHAASRRTRPGTWSPTSSACGEHLGIERWLVFGGSWGSTLALAYAETHPAAVTELVLRGIFLCVGRRSTGSTRRAPTPSSRTSGRTIVGLIPEESAATCWRPTTGA